MPDCETVYPSAPADAPHHALAQLIFGTLMDHKASAATALDVLISLYRHIALHSPCLQASCVQGLRHVASEITDRTMPAAVSDIEDEASILAQALSQTLAKHSSVRPSVMLGVLLGHYESLARDVPTLTGDGAASLLKAAQRLQGGMVVPSTATH